MSREQVNYFQLLWKKLLGKYDFSISNAPHVDKVVYVKIRTEHQWVVHAEGFVQTE